MTREEAKRFLHSRIDLIDLEYPSETDYRDALVLAVNALEQQPMVCKSSATLDAEKLEKCRQRIKEQIEDGVILLPYYIDLISPREPKTEWIPCSDKLPEEREWYLAIFKEKDTGYQLIPRVADYIGKGKNKWQVIDEEGLCQEYRDILECIAWMPLPEPYKESEG